LNQSLLAILLFLFIACEQKITENHVQTEQYDHIDPSYGKVLGERVDGKVKGGGQLLQLNHATDDQIKAYETWFTENQERHLKDVTSIVSMKIYPDRIHPNIQK